MGINNGGYYGYLLDLVKYAPLSRLQEAVDAAIARPSDGSEIELFGVLTECCFIAYSRPVEIIDFLDSRVDHEILAENMLKHIDTAPPETWRYLFRNMSHDEQMKLGFIH